MYFTDQQKPGMKKYLRRGLWSGILSAAAASGFGLYAVISPIGTLTFFVAAVGLFLTVNGLVQLIYSLTGLRRDRMWYIGAAGGVLQLLLGFFIVSQPSEISNTALMLATVGIGMTGIAAGTVNMISGIRYRDAARNIWSFIARGALLFIIGVMMLLAPYGFGTATIRAAGVIGILSGILQLWTVIRLYLELKD